MISNMDNEDAPQFIAGWRGWGFQVKDSKIKATE